MKKLTLVLILLGVFLLVFSSLVLSQEKAKTEQKAFKYIGTFKCKLCHNSPQKGKVYDWWAGEKHSKAYLTLANEQSKNIAKGMGIADAQKSDKCLTCHVTGYATPPEQKGLKYSMEEGVTCEACHGPGEAYQAMKYMKDPALGMKEAGLIKPTNEVCITCHNKKSPTYKEFNFEVAKKQIKHGPATVAPTK
ncbi:MAG: cytochrome C554 [candidate division Zixibacteria bacterium]|nr:cytochrome C554 [candidate division Zixibacteria bacterium]